MICFSSPDLWADDAAEPAAASLNLVRNPGFEEGDWYPLHWDRVDGLTSFYREDGPHGRFIEMDTDVLQEDFNRRQEEMVFEEHPPPWPKRPTQPPKYDTVGGNEGVKLYSDPIPVKPGMKYIVSCDGKQAGGTPKLFVRGYGRVGQRERKLYDTYINLRGEPDVWTHHEQEFNPTLNTPAVTHIRVMLYAYWPAGRYAWDNIAVREAGLDPRYKPLKEYQPDELSQPRQAIHFEEDEEPQGLLELMDRLEREHPDTIWIDTIIAKGAKVTIRCLADTQDELEKYRASLEAMPEVRGAVQKRIRAIFRQEAGRQVFEAMIELTPAGAEDESGATTGQRESAE